MALDVVSDYVSLARVLLQDTVNSPYRYSDSELVTALSLAFMEAKFLRPDLFLGVTTIPNFTVNDATAVSWDPMYRVAMVYYMCGHAQMRDDEEVQDTRAAAFLALFKAKLGTLS